jgi:hypothetical protein
MHAIIVGMFGMPLNLMMCSLEIRVLGTRARLTS